MFSKPHILSLVPKMSNEFKKHEHFNKIVYDSKEIVSYFYSSWINDDEYFKPCKI